MKSVEQICVGRCGGRVYREMMNERNASPAQGSLGAWTSDAPAVNQTEDVLRLGMAGSAMLCYVSCFKKSQHAP